MNSKELPFEQVKSECSAEKLAQWIANERKEPVNKSGNGYRIGEKKENPGISVGTKDGVVVVNSFNGAGLKGDVIDVIQTIRSVSKSEALEIAANEIACIQIDAAQSKKLKKRTAETAAERKPIYEAFKQGCADWLVDGMQQPIFEPMMKNRGLDASKIATLPRVGFATDDTKWFNSPDSKIMGIRIKKNSFVFWNDDDCTIKAIPLDPKTGKRSKSVTPTQLGSCHWMPFDNLNEATNIYLCEGETSAIALMFSGIQGEIPARAIPLKPDGNGKDIIIELAKSAKQIYLAYDNDKTGRDKTQDALALVPSAIDISGLWCGPEWNEGADPNDFVKKYGPDAGQRISQYIEQLKEQQTETQNETQEELAKIDYRNIENLKQYFTARLEKNQTKAEQITRQDPVFGEFIKLVDPFYLRKHAAAFCLVSWGVVRLANYEIKAPSNPRIINLVSKSSGGKDWMLGTLERPQSHSLFYQLNRNKQIDASKSADASMTGNGMSKAAFVWAAEHKDDNKILVKFRPEMGNAQTRGYGTTERAGSISNYDISICDGKITKPENKADLRELKDYEPAYKLECVEVRAFQDINGAEIVLPRLRGSGEARREFWFYMTSPTEDLDLPDDAAPFVDSFLYDNAFTSAGCDEAFKILDENALDITPHAEYFDEEIDKTIKTSQICDNFTEIYSYLRGTICNQYLKADKWALLRDKAQYLAGLSAGMHGRKTACKDDYWIAAYLCECLADSLDTILDCAGPVEDPNSERTRILERVRSNGIKGVYKHKLSDNTKLLDELCGLDRTRDGAAVFMPGAPLVRCMVANKRHLFIASEFVEQAKKEHPKLNEIVFYK